MLCLEIFCVLEIIFSEPNQYKCECKSALVRPLLLCGSSGFSISAQVKKDL
jgi:hypothetical protein